MSGFKSSALVISEKATPVAPSNPGEVTIVARDGKLYKYDGVTESEIGAGGNGIQKENVDFLGYTFTDSVQLSGSLTGYFINGTLIGSAAGDTLIYKNDAGNLSIQNANGISSFTGNEVILSSLNGDFTISSTTGHIDISPDSGYDVRLLNLVGNTEKLIKIGSNGEIQASDVTVPELPVVNDVILDYTATAEGNYNVIDSTDPGGTGTFNVDTSSLGPIGGTLIIGVNLSSGMPTMAFAINGVFQEDLNNSTYYNIVIDEGGNYTKQVVSGFPVAYASSNQVARGNDPRLNRFVGVPSNSTSTGKSGQYAADANYLYVCYSDNNWIRIAKDTW